MAKTVIVIGAGLGGLTLAIALQRQGHRVRVFERAPKLLEVGAGITLFQNSMRAFEYLGLATEVDRISFRPKHAATKDFSTGRVLKILDLRPESDVDLGERTTPVRQAHRADLQSLLAAQVLQSDPEAIALGCELVDLDEQPDGIVGRFRNGRSVLGDILVGCDGNRSVVRERLFGSGSPEFLNYVAWRGLIPTEHLASDLVTPETAMFIGERKSFVRYKVRGGELVNYVAFARSETWAADEWVIPSTVDEVSEVFADAADEVRQIIRATPPNATFKWGLVGRPPLENWTVGRATLLGDAAHAMLPFLGQGAGMAFEDAIVFTRALQSTPSISEALDRYQRTRLPRTTLAVRSARHVGLKMHGVHDEQTAAAAGLYDEAAVAAFDPVAEPLRVQ